LAGESLTAGGDWGMKNARGGAVGRQVGDAVRVLTASYALEPGSPIKGFSRRHGRKRRNPLTKTQRHKDTKIEKPFMASYLSFLLRVFVSL
jgi:hypothetical protein